MILVTVITSADVLVTGTSLSSVNHTGELAIATPSANQPVVDARNSSTVVTFADIHAVENSSSSANHASSEVASVIDICSISNPSNNAIIAGTSKTFYNGVSHGMKQNKHEERRPRVSVIDISPIPLPCQKEPKRKVRQKRSEILTSSPLKQMLQEKNAKQILKKEKDAKQQEAVKEIKKRESEAKRAKKRLLLDNSHQIATKKVKKQPLTRGKKTRNKKSHGRNEALASSEVWICSNCNMQYGDVSDPRSSEDWLQCVGCMKTYHISCGEQNGIVDDDDTFSCKTCVC